MKREDFVFDHMDDEYEDYWFKVIGDTKDELTDDSELRDMLVSLVAEQNS